MVHDNQSPIPCCPDLIKDDHCNIINFSRVLTYPTVLTANSRRRINVEVILHFKFSRCTLGLTLGDPAYSTTLLPGEKVRLAANNVTNNPPAKMWEDVWFEYTGQTSLTVKGSVSRNVYRFNAHGDKQLIDYRDASAMMAVPVLKK